MNNEYVQLYNMILKFVRRQEIVFHALKELRPHILLSTGAINKDDLLFIPKSRFDIPQLGVWRRDDEWKYYIHGLGCKLIHSETKEPIEWNAPNLNSFDTYWFINWLKWYLESNTVDEELDFGKFQNLDDFEKFVRTSLLKLEEENVITRLSIQYPQEYTLMSPSPHPTVGMLA